MDNSDNSAKCKNKKERASNTSISTNESPFVSPVASPTIEPNNETVKVPIIDNKLNNYKLPISQKNSKETIGTTETTEIKLQNSNENKEDIKEIDISLDSLILNLKIISKLKPGYKLSIKENNGQVNDVYIDTSYLQYVYRMFSDNSRDHTTKFLEMLDKEITKKIEELVKEENYTDSNMFLNSKENILLNLSHNLNLSLVGLNNLINTYANDEYTISKIEMIINNFELKIRKISNILKVNK
jgi:hypothetical protein